MTIATAIRNLPEPPGRGGAGGSSSRVVGLALGLLLVYSGDVGRPGDAARSRRLARPHEPRPAAPASRASPSGSRSPRAGRRRRLPHAALALAGGRVRAARMDFSTWIVAGLMIVIGTVWVIVFNADLLLGGVMRVFGRIEPRARAAHVDGVSAARPLPDGHDARDVHARRLHARHRVRRERLVRARDRRRGLRRRLPGARGDGRRGADRRHGGRAADARRGSEPPTSRTSAASPCSRSRRSSSGRAAATRRTSSAASTPRSSSTRRSASGRSRAATARRRRSGRRCATHPGLAVVDSSIVPRRDNFNFGVAPTSRSAGSTYEEGTFDPIPIEVRDQQTGRTTKLTVIGILKDTAPLEMVGISTSQETLATAFPGRAQPTIHYFGLAPGVDPEDDGGEARVRVPRRTGWRRSRSRRSSTTRSRRT